MRVTLFEIGDFAVRSYGVIVALAILLALGVAYFLTKNTIYQSHLFDSFIFVLIAGMIGARIWHVFFFQWEILLRTSYRNLYHLERRDLHHGGHCRWCSRVGDLHTTQKDLFLGICGSPCSCGCFRPGDRPDCLFSERGCLWFPNRFRIRYRLSERYSRPCYLEPAVHAMYRRHLFTECTYFQFIMET